MNNAEIASYYTELLEEHHSGFRVGDHGSLISQMARFDALLWAYRPDEPASLLDVGCGTGDLLDYSLTTDFGRHRQMFRYEGWDISEKIITRARALHEGENFRTRDLMDSDRTGSYDFVVASGLFQFRDTGYLIRAVGRMFELCRKVVAFNFLTKSDDTPGETSHNPLTLLSFFLGLTPKVVLRMDYLPNDATIYLYR